MRDIVASQSGHEVISLQKEDSLLVFLNVTEKLRRFLRRNAGGIWIRIHLDLMNTPGQGSHNRQEDDLYKAKTSYPYVDVVDQV